MSSQKQPRAKKLKAKPETVKHKTLTLFGELSPEQAAVVCIELYEHKGPVTLLVNSSGGDSVSGMAIANMLRAHAHPTTAIVIGEACSAAIDVIVAAESIFAFPNSSFMLHDESLMGSGKAREVRAMAKITEQRDEDSHSWLAERTGKTIDFWRNKLAGGDLWLSAQDAEDLNLIDGILYGSR